MDNYRTENNILEKFDFLTSCKNWYYGPATEKTVDMLFECAYELEAILIQGKENNISEIFSKNFSDLCFHKPVDAVLENIIKNQYFDENITLYAIKKYIILNKKSNFSKFLERFLSEVDLRNEIFKLVKQFSDIDLDLFKLNNFLCGLLNSPDISSRMLYALKSQTSVLLKALQNVNFIIGQGLINEMILCLESQTDLRLWFTVMKDENLDVVLDLCATYNNFFNATLKFFDKYADEIESTYDEELNIQYSHVNLDFEKFVEVLHLFLNKSKTKSILSKYLDSKTLSDKNFCFWVDVKACL